MGIKELAFSKSVFYKTVMSLMGADRGNTTLANEYIRPQSTDRIIDIGCGPAAILDYLPHRVQYLGVDYNPNYIKTAKDRFKSRGDFQVLDINNQNKFENKEAFDLALGIGVLHHLSDKEVSQFFKFEKRNLKKSGRLITYDGCYLPRQNPIAKWLLDHDRGKYVRKPEQYTSLAQMHFSRVSSHQRSDLSRIPYDVVIMECQ